MNDNDDHASQDGNHSDDDETYEVNDMPSSNSDHGYGASSTPANQPPAGTPVYVTQKEKGGVFSKVASGLITSILLVSLLVNVYLYFIVQATLDGSSEVTYQKGDSERRIVVIPVSGMIDDTMARFVHRAFADIEDEIMDNPDDPNVAPAAVILRVDSGGGGVAASDRIWNDVTTFQQAYPDIPVVASFGSVAASGGYYISAGADYIYAEPTCITGSIGVIAQAFTVQELMDKIGVTPQVVVAEGSPQKDVLNPFRTWGEKDMTLLRSILNESHDRFVHVVHEGRKDDGIDEEKARELASGLPFTANEAVESKLVNEVGYLEDAIDKAVELSGLSFEKRPKVMMVRQSGGFASLLGLSSSSPNVSAEKIDGEQIRSWLSELSAPRLEYRFALPNR